MALQILSSFAAAGNQSPSVIEALGAATLRRAPFALGDALKKKKGLVPSVGRAAFDQAARRFAEARRGLRGAGSPLPDRAQPALCVRRRSSSAEEPDRRPRAFREEIRVAAGPRLRAPPPGLRVLEAGDSASRPARGGGRAARSQELRRAQCPGSDRSSTRARWPAPSSSSRRAASSRPTAPRCTSPGPRLRAGGREEDADRARAEFRRLDEIRKSLGRA